MSTEREQLLRAISALEAQQVLLGDTVVRTAVAPLRERLAALTPPSTQRRRHVTVLFGDVCDFTALTEGMDAEDVNELVNSLWEKVDAIILRNGGRIDKHIGDAVMALWGMDAAREDDPERAVRAALELQAEMASWRMAGKALTLRIGLNTGLVLVGAVGSRGELTAMGDTVNTANRLERAAPHGSVLISHATYRRVSGAFEVLPLEPLVLKGKQEPLQAYRVLLARPRAFQSTQPGLLGVTSRLIGRADELAQLADAVADLSEPGCRLITLTGEAGVGKSRLLRELNALPSPSADPPLAIKGRASQEMRGQPHALFRDLFCTHFRVKESDAPQDVRLRLEEAFEEELGPGERSRVRAHLAGQLVGFDFSDSPYLKDAPLDDQGTRVRGLSALGEYFKALLSHSPTVLFLEDLHWADDSSLDLVERLGRLMADQRLLMVCTARPDFLERRPTWGQGHPSSVRLALAPLSFDDSRTLLGEILRKADSVPGSLRELLVTRAEGNPFYLEELVRMLLEEGVIDASKEPWRIQTSRLTQLQIPPTLVGVLQARLDGLPEREREILQRCAVVGRSFWDESVGWLGGVEGVPDEVREALVSLQGRGLVVELQSASFLGTREYAFRHALLREVTYDTVLKRERREYHRRIAEWLLHRGGERSRELVGLVADHLEAAGETSRAAHYLRRAGEEALARFANTEALTYLDRALENMGPQDEPAERYATLAARERVHGVLGERHAQRLDMAALDTLAESLGDERRQTEVALRRALYAWEVCDLPTGVAAAKRAIALAERVGDALAEATAHLRWGRMLRHLQGDFVGARPHFERSLALAEAARLEHLKVECLLNLGAVHNEMGHYGRGTPYLDQALALALSMGDRWLESSAQRYQAYVYKMVGDFARAQAAYEQTLPFCRMVGYRLWEAADLCNLAFVYNQIGAYTRAIECGGQALEISEEIGNTRYQGYAWMALGHALLGLERAAESGEAFQRSLELRQAAGMAHLAVESRAGVAAAALAAGNLLAAWEHVDAILRFLIHHGLDGTEEPLWIHLICVRVLYASRDPRGEEFLETAHRELETRKQGIQDEALSRSFANIPKHRELEEAWRDAQG